MSKKHKKVCGVLNYIEHLLSFVSTVTGCLSISAFAPLLFPVGITSSAVGLKICVVIAGIKNYKSIIKKKKKKYDKITLSAESKLNSIGVLISNITHDEYVSINNVLKEYDNVKEEIKNSKT